MASALPYGTHEKKLRLAMRIGGDYRVYPERDTWHAGSKDLDVDSERLVSRVRHNGMAIADAFADAVNAAPEVRALKRPMPNELVDLIADRATRCLRLVGTNVPTV